MGSVRAEITLKNVFDERKAREGFIKEEEIRSVTIQALVDTGAMSLVITEELCQKLGLRIIGQRLTRVANGQRESCKVTEPVKIQWKNRFSSLSALVLPGLKNVLLGVVPLEDMDLMVNPVTQELVGVHGDVAETMVMSPLEVGFYE